jgi:LmbE family N-acetylglucosaminyl deacetylase
LLEADPTTLVVFSHPNHELAVYGLLQRLRPRLVYLTDGGGGARLAQTRRGLESVGLQESARFLGHTEASFYEALLARDSDFYAAVAEEVRDCVRAHAPARVLCDAVEFYNPLHDLALPVVRAALGRSAGAQLFEVPLVYQRPAEVESYEVQRVPASRRGEQFDFRLSGRELEMKVWARDRVYAALAEQMGPLITDLPRARLALEVVTRAREVAPEPAPDIFLRYERRAQVLAERGEIERQITYKEHYLPVASSLLKA